MILLNRVNRLPFVLLYADSSCKATIIAAKERPIPINSGKTLNHAVLACCFMTSLASSSGVPQPVHLKQPNKWRKTDMVLIMILRKRFHVFRPTMQKIPPRIKVGAIKGRQ